MDAALHTASLQCLRMFAVTGGLTGKRTELPMCSWLILPSAMPAHDNLACCTRANVELAVSSLAYICHAVLQRRSAMF